MTNINISNLVKYLLFIGLGLTAFGSFVTLLLLDYSLCGTIIFCVSQVFLHIADNYSKKLFEEDQNNENEQ